MFSLLLLSALSGRAQFFPGYYGLGLETGSFVPPESGMIGNWRVTSSLIPPDHSYMTISNIGSPDEWFGMLARNWGSGEPGKFIEMLIPAERDGWVEFNYIAQLEVEGVASWTNDGGSTWNDFMDTVDLGLIYGNPFSFQIFQGVEFGFRVETNPVGYDMASLQVMYFTVSAIPEPSTYTAVAGLVVLGMAIWRRQAVRFDSGL